MRRKPHLILSVAAIGSLAVMIVTVVLWIWSNYAQWNRIELDHQEVTELLDHHGRPFLADERYRGVLFESGNVILYRLSMTVGLGPKSAWEFNERVAGADLREPGQWVWTASQPDAFGSPDAYAEVGIRSWVIIVACSIVPVWWSVVVVRGRRHHDEGCCSHCGYDLRATPGRCPECGTAAV